MCTGLTGNQKLLRAGYDNVVLACWAIDSAFLLPAGPNSINIIPTVSNGNISLKKS